MTRPSPWHEGSARDDGERRTELKRGAETMATRWIKLRDLRNHPKVRLLATRLGVHKNTVIGALAGLWHDCDQFAKDDRMDLTPELIDEEAGIPGFANALSSSWCEWLIIEDGFVVLPDYEEHNGSTAKSRCEATLRQRSHRDVTHVTKKRDRGVTREDKKREDKTREPDPVAIATGGARRTEADVDEEIYQTYPRHIGKQDAKKAIAQAVKALRGKGVSFPRKHLLERTRAFAAAVAPFLSDSPDVRQYVPHPGTWFRAGRYDDDEAEWTVHLKRDGPQGDSPEAQARRVLARMEAKGSAA
jgi:hypothetical protein